MSEAEVTELKNAGVYIAGFTDSSIKRRNDLWDVLVDGTLSSPSFNAKSTTLLLKSVLTIISHPFSWLAVSERKITIADDVQDTFSESSFHKDLLSYLREAAVDDEIGSEDIIAVCSKESFRTTLNKLASSHNAQRSAEPSSFGSSQRSIPGLPPVALLIMEKRKLTRCCLIVIFMALPIP